MTSEELTDEQVDRAIEIWFDDKGHVPTQDKFRIRMRAALRALATPKAAMVSREQMRDKIATDPDIDCDAGIPSAAAPGVELSSLEINRIAERACTKYSDSGLTIYDACEWAVEETIRLLCAPGTREGDGNG